VANRTIQLRGVEVHNLKGIDLDLLHRQLIAICGVSGSGKTSLALDTLYAEGQRRYMETFSTYTRQFLEQLEKPTAVSIDGLPPAIAVTRKNTTRSQRSTIATATETADYLRLLYARCGEVHCSQCQQPIRRDSPESMVEQIAQLPSGRRVLLGFEQAVSAEQDLATIIAQLLEEGFVRVVGGERLWNLSSDPIDPARVLYDAGRLLVVVDRLTTGSADPQRWRDSLETSFRRGQGRCWLLIEQGAEDTTTAAKQIEDRSWRELGFSDQLECVPCGVRFSTLQPQLFSFNHALGACPTCEGFGNITQIDVELVVPDPAKTLRGGAIAPWQSNGFSQEQEHFLQAAEALHIPLDIPFRELSSAHWELIRDGSAEHAFGGLRGFFESIEKQKYKLHYRLFLSRWRSYRECPTCHGSRLKQQTEHVLLGGKSFSSLCQLKIGEALPFLRTLSQTNIDPAVARNALEPILSRLEFLSQVGLDYLSLDRSLRTLSGGEAQRVALASALGSNLVNMLYVLDEPSVGLHPRDVERLLGAIVKLRDRGNTVVVIEHEEAILKASDQLIEIGPAAGERGGQLVFQGTLAEMFASDKTLTGPYLSGQRGVATPEKRRAPAHGWLRLTGARGHNLKNITVEFPLGVLCVVTGVSGSGKSTLVQDTLYGAICRRKRIESERPLPYDDIFGDGQIDDVLLLDQDAMSRSPRSNPVTFIKAFDEIRRVFAETPEAKSHHYTAGHFSFNVEGGRCTHCEGDGHIQIDMQFLADVFMKCPQCHGRRYKNEVLKVLYRGRNIADVLEMTVREAFSFFRGQAKVQVRLKRLIDVGLDYLRLGQSANTLSSGEAQRLKLAAYMSEATRNRTLFILDEPTTGLHFHDIVQLLDCFETLLSVGHSLIVVEHNLQLMKAADYIIDLGPGAGEQGGEVAAAGTPEHVAAEPRSVTGQLLLPYIQSGRN
jgi:excinuclease ABC subunit A